MVGFHRVLGKRNEGWWCKYKVLIMLKFKAQHILVSEVQSSSIMLLISKLTKTQKPTWRRGKKLFHNYWSKLHKTLYYDTF